MKPALPGWEPVPGRLLKLCRGYQGYLLDLPGARILRLADQGVGRWHKTCWSGSEWAARRPTVEANVARREQRERIVLPVKVHGSNARGEPFAAMACVTDFSQNGARLEGVQCVTHVNEVISLEHEGQWMKFRVAWVGEPGTRMAGCLGLQSLEPIKKLFGVELPPPGPDTFDPTQPHDLRATTGVLDRRVQERRQQEERRRHPRFKCGGSVEIRIAGTQLVTWARISDICLGGCYTELSSPFPVDTPVELTLNVGEERVRTRAVVRSHHPGFGMGIAFVETAPQQIEALKRIVAVLSGAVPAATPKVVPIAAPGPRPAAAAATLEEIVKWFGTHDTLTRADFLHLVERNLKKPTG